MKILAEDIIALRPCWNDAEGVEGAAFGDLLALAIGAVTP